MDSTMMDIPLTVGMLLRHGTTVHGDGEVVTGTGDGTRHASYAQVGRRAAQLARALRGLGVTGDQRVATFQWNNQEHLEAYLAIPAMGAVVHTLNLRLPPDQVAWIANHAEDDVVIVDSSLVSVLARALPEMKTVRHVIIVGPANTPVDITALDDAGKQLHFYHELLAAQPEDFDWPCDIDERSAAVMCYTSGTT
ncbi:MAG: AMP-binding protein, partial [Pseudonocardiaceae bacterium]